MEKIFTLAGLELEPAPTPELTIDLDIPVNKQIFGDYTVRQLQDITLADDALSGSSFYCERLFYQGNYVALHVTSNTPGTIRVYNIAADKATVDADGIAVVKYYGSQTTITAELVVDEQVVATKTLDSRNVQALQQMTARFREALGALPEGKDLAEVQNGISFIHPASPTWSGTVQGTSEYIDQWWSVTQASPCHCLAFDVSATQGVNVTVKEIRADDSFVVIVPTANGDYIIPLDTAGATKRIDIELTRSQYESKTIKYNVEQVVRAEKKADIPFDFMHDAYQVYYKNKMLEDIEQDMDYAAAEESDPRYEAGVYDLSGSLISINGWEDFDQDVKYQNGHYVVMHYSGDMSYVNAVVYDSEGTQLYSGTPDEDGWIGLWVNVASDYIEIAESDIETQLPKYRFNCSDLVFN